MFPQSTIKFPDNPERLTTLGDRLRWLRQKHRLTLAAFGLKLGVGRSYISKLENGKNQNVSMQFRSSLSRVFQVNDAWFISAQGKPFRWDNLNEAIEKGDYVNPPPVPLSSKSTDYTEAVRIAGIAINLAPNIGSLVAELSRNAKHPGYSEAVRSEILHILIEELMARVALYFKESPELESFKDPASDLGLLAVAAMKYHNDVLDRERTRVFISEFAKIGKNEGLTEVTPEGNSIGVKSELDGLIARVKRAAKLPGAKAALARFLGVAPARITEWLSDDPEVKTEPGGYYTLKLLNWVQQQERQK